MPDASAYEDEWQRQLARADIPDAHLPVHRWYLRHDNPASVPQMKAPRDGLTIVRAKNPTVDFYRFLYHTAGEEYLWGDRRRMADDDLAAAIAPDHIHIMVLYCEGVPAGFYELSVRRADESHIKYFALLPGFTGGGLGRYMLNAAMCQAAERGLPVVLDTCTLDHPVALKNYLARGFSIYREDDEIYPDPRLDGTVPRKSGAHVSIPV